MNAVEAHAGAVCSDHPRAPGAGLCTTSDSDPARDCPAARQCYVRMSMAGIPAGANSTSRQVASLLQQIEDKEVSPTRQSTLMHRRACLDPRAGGLFEKVGHGLSGIVRRVCMRVHVQHAKFRRAMCAS